MTDRTVTHWLQAWGQGDVAALEAVMSLIYDELQKLASGYLRREKAGHTLDTGALVHEAFLRLLPQQEVSWQNRSHFFGIAAQMMRRILVDHAREKFYARRGGGAPHTSLDEALQVPVEEASEVLLVDEGLQALEKLYPQEARVVELSFFGGLSQEEIGQVMELSVPTIKRRWRFARAWLETYFSSSRRSSEESLRAPS